MKTDITALLQSVDLLHHLPVTSLEKQLERCKLLNPVSHSRVLSPEEMVEYILWMSNSFSSREDFRFSEDDIFILTGGSMGQAGHDMIKQPATVQTQQQIADIFHNPSEAHFFSESQSVCTSRLLRHLPAYWQTGDYFDLYYVYSGSFPVWVEDEQILLSPGNLLLIPPGTRKACKCPDDDCVVFLYMIRSSTFSKVFWEQLSSQNLMSLFFRQALSGQGSTTYLRFSTDCDPSLETLLYAIYLQYASDDIFSTQMTHTLMSTFFLSLLQNFQHTAAVSQSSSFFWKPAYSAILTYIQDHYQTVTLEELARVFSYSQRQIIRIIQSSTSKTLTQLVAQLRMEKAADMMASPTLSLEEIAVRLGYASLSSFYRSFVNYYGITPGQWRAHHRKEQPVTP